MRLVNIPSRHLIKLYNGMYETTMKGSIIINYQPSEEYHLVNKKYVDDIINNIDFSKLETTIDKNVFFNYPGDFEKNSSGDYMLKKSTGLTNGHIVFNVNGKGLSSSSAAKIPPELWGDKLDDSIINKDTLPSTPEGLGIKDVITTDGKGVTNKGFETTDALTNPKSVITPKKERIFYNPKMEYDVGDIVLIEPKNVSKASDFININGQTLKISENRELYEKVGDGFGYSFSTIHGHPDRLRLSEILPPELGEITYEERPIVDTLSGFAITSTKNKVFLFGGYHGDRTKPLNHVYMATVSDGVLGSFNRIGDLPEPLVFSKALIYNNMVMLVGGTKNPTITTSSKKNFYAPINPDGSIGAWKTFGVNLNGEFSNTHIYLSGNRMYLIGGEELVSFDTSTNKVTLKPNKKRAWSLLDSKGIPTGWKYDVSDIYSCVGSEMTKYTWGFLTLGRSTINRKKGQEYQYNNVLSDRMFVTTPGWNISLEDLVTSKFVGSGGGANNSPYGLGNGFWCFFSCGGTTPHSDFPFGMISRQQEPGGGGVSLHSISFPGSPMKREHFNLVVTSKYIYVLGGLDGDSTESYTRTYKQKTIRIGFNESHDANYFLGKDDLSEFYKEVIPSKDTFKLPLVDPMLVDGKPYSYYIKVK